MTEQHPGATELQQHLQQLPDSIDQLDKSQIKQVGDAIVQNCDAAMTELRIDTSKLPSAPSQASEQSAQISQLPQQAQQSLGRLMAIASQPEDYVPRAQQPRIDPVFQKVDQSLQRQLTNAGVRGFGNSGRRL